MDEATYWLNRRLRECGRKVRYLNKQTADRNVPRGSRQVSYECHFCKFWHTGHLKKRVSAPVA